jgi:dolichol-phosphate mannosyltransferase
MQVKAPVRLPEPWAAANLAVVVPTYNESINLPKITERLFDLPLTNLRLIVVDDNSPDGTGDIADELAAKMNVDQPDRMVVLHRTAKEGLGRAYVAGMREALARGDQFVVQMDADLSHEPEMVPQMLGTMLSTEADLVIGSRYVPGGSLSEKWGLHRRLLSRGASVYVNVLMRLGIRDTTAGFKLWRADVLNRIDLDRIMSDGFGFQIEMTYRCLQLRHKIVEIPIHFEERFSGTSKINLRIQIEALKLPFKLKYGKRGR